MPDMLRWTASVSVAPARAEDAWRRISEKPAQLVLTRKDAILPVQTVRVEPDSTDTEVTGNAGTSARRGVTVFGVMGHRLIQDTDIRRGDTFTYNGMHYRVMSVIFNPGEVQARCEAQA